MKAMFFNLPAHGHVNPTIPLVKEIIKSGDTVIYYNIREFQKKIESSGAEFRTCSEIEEHEIFLAENPFELANSLWNASEDFFPFFISEIEKEKPDFIIHDSLCTWGWALAKIFKIPAICSTTTFALNFHVFREVSNFPWNGLENFWKGRNFIYPLKRKIQKLQKQYKFPKRDLLSSLTNSSDLNLVFTSKEFQPASNTFSSNYHFIGPSVPDAQETGDFPMETLVENPVVYISLGTLRNNRLDFFNTCIEAFQDLPFTFVLSIGNKVDHSNLLKNPANFIIRTSVPQIEILKKANLFITHGGMNSVNEGLYFGVPLLVFPQTSEQSMVARRVESLGAGQYLSEKDISKKILIKKVFEVLNNSKYYDSAQKQKYFLHNAGGLQRAVQLNRQFKDNFT
mgnify:CR=1 FL=1